MIKRLLVGVFLLSNQFLQCVSAQTSTIDVAYGTSSNIVMGVSNYHVSEYLYYNSELGASNFLTAATAINKVEFSASAVGAPTTFAAVKVYMQNVPATTTTLPASTYSTTGYTLVYSGNYLAPNAGWAGVDLTTPFVRTAGTNLLVMVERQDNVTHPGYVFNASNASGAVNSRRYNGTAALTSTTALSTSAFRASIRLKHALANDALVSQVLALGKLPIGSGSSTVTTTVTNNGNNTLNSLPVTLTVTGANSYTASQTLATLAAGASAIVSFTAYNPTALGNNTLTVSVPADDDNANNTSSFNQITGLNTISYANNDSIYTDGAIGFGAGSGYLVNKYQLKIASSLISVRASISSNTGAVGNTIYGVLLSSAGVLIAQTANYTVQTSDQGNYVTFTFPTPQALAANTDYLLGIAQTANTAAYYPLNVQIETPGRSGAYYSTVLGGGTPTEYTTLNRFMIDGVFSNALPVSLLSFSGERHKDYNNLSWTTATEQNNTGFELQRSADGINYSKLGFIASKATNGNSSAALTYSFDDVKPLTSNGYYRLKQIDKDGKSTTSSTVLIKGLSVSTLTVSTIYPNPVKNSLNVIVTGATQNTVTLIVADFSGKVLSSQTKQMVSGDNQYQINTSALASGNYLLKVTDSKGETTTQRFTKQ